MNAIVFFASFPNIASEGITVHSQKMPKRMNQHTNNVVRITDFQNIQVSYNFMRTFISVFFSFICIFQLTMKLFLFGH